MAWGLCRRSVLGKTPRAPRHCRIWIGLIGGILGKQPNLVLPRVDIGSLVLTYSRCHQQMLESLQDSSEKRSWIRTMSLVRSHRLASYAVTIIAAPIFGGKRPQRRYCWSLLRQRSWNDHCIADRSVNSPGENCSSRDLGNELSDAFLEARILKRGLGLEQMILGPT